MFASSWLSMKIDPPHSSIQFTTNAKCVTWISNERHKTTPLLSNTFNQQTILLYYYSPIFVEFCQFENMKTTFSKCPSCNKRLKSHTFLNFFLHSAGLFSGVDRLWAVERLSGENHPPLIVVFTLGKNHYEQWEKIQKLSFFPTAQSRFKLG